MVPEPPRPTRGASSPKCGLKLEISASLPAPHSPRSPEILEAPHSLGHSLQGSSISLRREARRASSPVLRSSRYLMVVSPYKLFIHVEIYSLHEKAIHH